MLRVTPVAKRTVPRASFQVRRAGSVMSRRSLVRLSVIRGVAWGSMQVAITTGTSVLLCTAEYQVSGRVQLRADRIPGNDTKTLEINDLTSYMSPILTRPSYTS